MVGTSDSKLLDFQILDYSNFIFQIPGLPGGLKFVPIFFLELQIRVYPDLIKIIANLNEPKDQGLFNNNPILQKIE